MSTRGHAGPCEPSVCLTSKLENTSASIPRRFASSSCGDRRSVDRFCATRLQWPSSYNGTKSQREERIVLVWLAEDDSTALVLCSRKEGGGRSAGGSWRLLPTARSRSDLVTKRSG